MRTFAGCRGLLVVCLVVASCWADEPTSPSSSPPSSENDNSINGHHCMYNGQVIPHGDGFYATECSFCTCHKTKLSCQLTACQPLPCTHRVKLEGTCCKVCPYNVTVNEVVPRVIPSGLNYIQDGKLNEIGVDLDVKYAFNSEATSVHGEDLWTLRLWMSSRKDGTNELPGTVMEEALTEEQRSQSLSKSSERSLIFEDIRYRFDLTDRSCKKEAKYICAKFNKGPNPQMETDGVPFFFSAMPSEGVLTSCVKNHHCEADKLSDDLPCMRNGHITHHGETSMPNDCSFCSCDNSTLICQFQACPPLSCNHRIKLEGSCCMVCPYNFYEDLDVAPSTDSPQVTSILGTERAHSQEEEERHDIEHLTGTDSVMFSCMYNGRTTLHGETYQLTDCSFCSCDNSTLTCRFETCPPLRCTQRITFEGRCCKVCPYNVNVNEVVPLVPPHTIMKQGQENEIAMDLDVKYAYNLETTSVHGQELWTLRLWMSSSEDGTNKLSGTAMEEALTEGQRSQSLIRSPERSFVFEDIGYRFDLTDHTCKEAKFICAKFNKGPNPQMEREEIPFIFSARSQDVLTRCVENHYCGATAKVTDDDVDADVENDRATPSTEHLTTRL